MPARRAASELQRRDVRKVATHALERRRRICLLLDEEMLAVDVLDAREQALEVDGPSTKLGVVRRAEPRNILDMEGPVAGTEAAHVVVRVEPGHGEISGVELHANDRGIGALDQN